MMANDADIALIERLETENRILRDLLKAEGFRDRDIDVMVRALKRARERQT